MTTHSHPAFRSLSAVLCLWAVIGTTSGQQRLAQFSLEQQSKWRLNRAAAESRARSLKLPIRAVQKDGTTIELQQFSHGRPQYYTTNNLNAAISISTSRVWPGGGAGFGLNGSTDTVGEWDAGAVRMTHQEFGGRVLSTEGDLVDHSTHVAGTLIAAGMLPAAHGMSFQGYLRSFDWNDDLSEMASEAANGLRVSNHSYGTITGWWLNGNYWYWFGDTSISQTEDYRFGFYDDEARIWDSIAFLAPEYLIVKAAGNDRGEGPSDTVDHYIFVNDVPRQVRGYRPPDGGSTGYDCLNGAAVAKNVMVVGAVNDVQGGYSTPDSVFMTPFSSWGPTDDGRVKPDVVANGVYLFSTLSGADNAYGWFSGTSMASPGVSGSVGLLLQHQRNLHGSSVVLRAATLRGLIIHTADECGPAPGPDYQFGWGMMNTLSAAKLMWLDSLEGSGSHIIESVLNEPDVLSFPIKATGEIPLKVTLCWTDPPGSSPPPSLNPPNIMLVNDLDVRLLRDSDQTVYYPWILDPSNPSRPAAHGDNVRDNAEQVLVASPSAAHYTIRVSHKGMLAGGRQPFSLIISGNEGKPHGTLSLSRTTMQYSLIPDASINDSLLIRNVGDTVLNIRLAVLNDTTGWFTIGTDSVTVIPGGALSLHCSISSANLPQWTTHCATLSIQSDDPLKTRTEIPITLSVLGPRLVVQPLGLQFLIDSAGTASKLVIIRNTGFTTLTIAIARPELLPGWLTASPLTAAVAAGDSTSIELRATGNELSMGEYTDTLHIVSNDSTHVDTRIIIDCQIGLQRMLAVHLSPSWNLISLPLGQSDPLVRAIFPDAVSRAFRYTNHYEPVDSMTTGCGYWLKSASDDAITLTGSLLLIDTIPVLKGWNLIGSLSRSIPVDALTTDPAGVLVWPVFGYEDRYVIADSILPGKGYWVRVTQDASIVSESLFQGESQPRAPHSTRMFSLSESDLPPAPPGSDVSAKRSDLPASFALLQSYPDPFNPTTSIRYMLPADSRVVLKVYNLLGRVMETLVDEIQTAGIKEVRWNAGSFASGIYLYRIEAVNVTDIHDRYSQVGKMILLK